MAHVHGPHGHSHAPAHYGRAFLIGVTLNVTLVAVQVVYGLLAHSLALLADAGHNAGDVLGLLIAWAAFVLSRRRPTARYTYGWRRSSILASLANATLLFVATGGIVWEAVRRLATPEPVAGLAVAWVAGLGIAVNALTAYLFAAGSKHDLNLRGAFQHMLADAAVSFGVVLAGLLITFTGWPWLDPAISLLVSAVIVLGSWGLLRESVNLALDAVPGGVDPSAVKAHLAALPGVTGVHDLHVWGMSTTETALTAHLIMPQGVPDDAFYGRVQRGLHGAFGVEHATIQVERGQVACQLESDAVV